MLRIPVRSGTHGNNPWIRFKSSSSFIRNTFIDYFKENHGHQYVKSSAVVPLCDPTVPFVNAGMNQFKGVFLEQVDPPCSRAVNSQKCIRVGGKHNDLDVVGTDGTHHTFFEMLGNWSFGDYYKKEACQMAWDLLLGPYRLKPENLVVTYFAGDAVIGMQEDRECRDIWKHIGVPPSRLRALGAKDNFWEMGASGPCGPCTEIHHVNPDGSLTEIWNIVFIQCNRESDGTVKPLSRHHVDTGMGLERLAALLQGTPSNYDTDLFQPIIRAIEQNSKGVSPYGSDATLDCAYRRMADHARMISVCLADGAFPAASLNLKQIMRKCFKMSKDIFQNPHLVGTLYSEVADILGATYPELIANASDAKLIIEHEERSYAKLRSQMQKKWKELAARHPEVEAMHDVEVAGFAQGYTEFKQIMNKQKTTIIPGEVVFKLYDTHGFHEHIIQRIADLNNLSIDKEGFSSLLAQHKSRHKIALKEQSSNRAMLFNRAIETLINNGVKSTNDQPKYDYRTTDDKTILEPLRTKLLAVLNEDCEWMEVFVPSDRPYYLVTKDTNFYCEEGGQVCDTGIIRISENVTMNVDSVFKIRDFVFHKGTFSNVSDYVRCDSDVILEIDIDRRTSIMRNHTGVHLLNAAIRKVLPNSVVCQTGSRVSERGLYLNLSVYGDKLSQEVILKAQQLIEESIKANVPVTTRVTDSVALTREQSVLTVPGETYPEAGLRLVSIPAPLPSKELCCGSHVHTTGALRDCCITLVKGAGGNAPQIHALTGSAASEARELFCRAEKLQRVIHLAEESRRAAEVGRVRARLAALCGAGGGAPSGHYARCLALLDSLLKAPAAGGDIGDDALQEVANAELQEAVSEAARSGRHFVVHFLRCSYLMQECAVSRALALRPRTLPVLLMGCAGGTVIGGCTVPQEMVTEEFTAKRWLSCIVPVFHADILPAGPGRSHLTYAEMTGAKVSLINCEQLVQDAMRAALHYARRHAHTQHTQTNRQHN